jgi:hypothetical protein
LFEGIVNEDAKKVFFNAEEYTSGTYLITVTSEKGYLVQKLLIK